MVTATPFKQVRVVSDGKKPSIEPVINFKPAMSKKTAKSNNTALITDTAFTNMIVVRAFIGIFILLRLVKNEKLFSRRKTTSKRVNPKKSIKKFFSNLHNHNTRQQYITHS